jgi:hypothetical protein
LISPAAFSVTEMTFSVVVFVSIAKCFRTEANRA